MADGRIIKGKQWQIRYGVAKSIFGTLFHYGAFSAVLGSRCYHQYRSFGPRNVWKVQTELDVVAEIRKRSLENHFIGQLLVNAEERLRGVCIDLFKKTQPLRWRLVSCPEEMG